MDIFGDLVFCPLAHHYSNSLVLIVEVCVGEGSGRSWEYASLPSPEVKFVLKRVYGLCLCLKGRSFS